MYTVQNDEATVHPHRYLTELNSHHTLTLQHLVYNLLTLEQLNTEIVFIQ